MSHHTRANRICFCGALRLSQEKIPRRYLPRGATPRRRQHRWCNGKRVSLRGTAGHMLRAQRHTGQRLSLRNNMAKNEQTKKLTCVKYYSHVKKKKTPTLNTCASRMKESLIAISWTLGTCATTCHQNKSQTKAKNTK